MLKAGKVKIYNSWNGIISSDEKEYRFRKSDIDGKDVIVGDEVTFVSEYYPELPEKEQVLTARFVKKKELSK